VSGIRAPRATILGSDIAGRVVEVGADVTRFAPGDQVYGDSLVLKGGFAEYAVVPEAALAHKPDALTFVQASTIPQAGAIADQGTAGLEPGMRWLVNGGGGGSGSFAIQLAKAAGVHVTAVDNALKLSHMRSLGADEVIDYRQTDFTRTGQRYDRILDLVAQRSAISHRRALTPDGRYACVGGSVPSMLGAAFAGLVSKGRLRVLAVRQGPAHFSRVAELCVGGSLDIHVDREFGLDELPEALAHHGEGRALGKVVVRIE
jgi:NADPH:quinone reductase-like Zn-dependent oxidoreductase